MEVSSAISEGVEIAAGAALGGERLERPEATLELGGGASQRRFRVEVGSPGTELEFAL